MLKVAESKILSRGVSDPKVQAAIDKVRAYLAQHLFDTSSDLQWWSGFEGEFSDISEGLSVSQKVALEIATDTMLVHAGVQSWSLARAWLDVTRREADA